MTSKYVGFLPIVAERHFKMTLYRKDIIESGSLIGFPYTKKTENNFFSTSYEMRKNGYEWYLYPTTANSGIEALEEKRRTWGEVRFNEQYFKNGKINITNIEASVVLIANLRLRDGSKKRVLVCRLLKVDDREYALVISDFVDHNKINKGRFFKDNPVAFALDEVVHEKVLFFSRETCEWLPLALGASKAESPTMGIEFDINDQTPIRATRFYQGGCTFSYFDDVLWREKLPWLKTFKVHLRDLYDYKNWFPYDAMIDTRYNSLILVDTWAIELDLNEVEVTSTEACVKSDGFKYDEFFPQQGKESRVVFLDFDDPFGGQVWKPDTNSTLGIIEVSRPSGLSAEFYSREENGIAFTNG